MGMGALLSFVQSKSQPQVMAATAEATLCWQDSAAAKRPKMEAREDVEHGSANTPFVGVFCICISILVEHSFAKYTFCISILVGHGFAYIPFVGVFCILHFNSG